MRTDDRQFRDVAVAVSEMATEGDTSHQFPAADANPTASAELNVVMTPIEPGETALVNRRASTQAGVQG